MCSVSGSHVMKILRPQIISSRSGSYRTGRWTAHWRPTRHDRPPLNQSPIDRWGFLTSVTDGCSLFCFNIYQTLQALRFVLETRGPRQSASEPSNAAPKTSILYGLLCTVPRRKDGCCLQTIPSPLIHLLFFGRYRREPTRPSARMAAYQSLRLVNFVRGCIIDMRHAATSATLFRIPAP